MTRSGTNDDRADPRLGRLTIPDLPDARVEELRRRCRNELRRRRGPAAVVERVVGLALLACAGVLSFGLLARAAIQAVAIFGAR